ncbi:protein kinase [Streptomyces sp. ODS28]|uniref:protein kinase domain-containing protein n=1 Tax=Streptomyces sp. ODS28 TaxID=3136688 RepID=UPI0031F03F53
MDLAQGRYTVGELIGEGGMAAVYEAYDTALKRTVAVKMMSTELVAHAAHRTRFRREAEAAAAFQHPHVVAVHDVGEEPVPYIVMERLYGQTLDHWLRQGPLRPEAALACTSEVLDALHASHARGMVHRDIKPANVMVDNSGVKVTDFGIARALYDAAAENRLTQTGQAVGTPHYMSPEQFEGRGALDGRSDLYSVGAMLYELLTGAPPFDGDSVFQIGYKHVTMAPPSLARTGARVHPALDALIARALAKDPDERFPDAAAMRAEVDRLRERGEGAFAAPPQAADSDTMRMQQVPRSSVPRSSPVPQSQPSGPQPSMPQSPVPQSSPAPPPAAHPAYASPVPPTGQPGAPAGQYPAPTGPPPAPVPQQQAAFGAGPGIAPTGSPAPKRTKLPTLPEHWRGLYLSYGMFAVGVVLVAALSGIGGPIAYVLQLLPLAASLYGFWAGLRCALWPKREHPSRAANTTRLAAGGAMFLHLCLLTLVSNQM